MQVVRSQIVAYIPPFSLEASKIQSEICLLDRSGKVRMVLMDLSKTYNCIPHDLLLAKLEVYGFGLECLDLLNSYLTNDYKVLK